MIRLWSASFDGFAEFELTGSDADRLVLLLGLPIERTRTDAGIYVTINPTPLTDEGGPIYPDGTQGGRELDLFQCEDPECQMNQ